MILPCMLYNVGELSETRSVQGMKTIGTMIIAVAAHVAPVTCAAAEYALPRLPDGVLPNTEVATNFPLHVRADRLRGFSLTLDAGSCASNEVLVAVGCDSDGNGDLSFDEAAFVFGCDCGARYFVDYVAGTADDSVGETLAFDYRSFDPAWNMAKVVKRGSGSVGETVVETVVSRHFYMTLR